MVQLSKESARRMAKAVRTVESGPKDGPRESRYEATRSFGRRAIVTQAITPPSSAGATHSASAGWGFAQLQRYDLVLNKYVSFGTPVKVINPWPAATTTAIVGRVIWVHFVDGVWQMPGENCT